MSLQKVIESRLAEMKTRRKALVEGWGTYINAVGAYLKEKEGRELTEFDRMNIATCLENAMIEGGIRQKSRIFETTYADNIAFLGVQLPVIAALLPSLVLNKIAIVQALDRRQGSVFYLDVKYGQNKGEITEGDTMIGAKSGHAYGASKRRYAMNLIDNEVAGTGDGMAVTFTKTLAYVPVVAGSVSVVGGSVTFVDNGDGTLTGSVSGASGTINYSTGALSVTFAAAPALGVKVYVDYTYNAEKAANATAEVNVSLTGESLTAQDFKLKALYTLGAAIDLEKAHGLNLEDELVKFLGGEIKFEIDHYGIDLIDTASSSVDAAAPVGNWDATVGSGQEWVWTKYELLDRIEKGSNNIFAKTLRGNATFIVGGNNVIRVIRQLAPNFKASADLGGNVVPTGPYEVGTLDGRLVIQDPFLDENRYILGFRGDNYLFAGFIYAPYIPLFSTPTLIDANIKAQKGFQSSAGFKVINPGLYTYGTVSNLG